jgi:RNA recognition motif-containing protein
LSTTVLVSNLPLSVDSIMLKQMFSVLGNVRKAVIHLDVATCLSSGYGFVEMSSKEEAKNCVRHFDVQKKKEGGSLSVRTENFLAFKLSPFAAVARQALIQRVHRSVSQKIKAGKS